MLNLWIDLWHHEGTTPSVSFIQSWCIKIFLATLNNLSFTLYPSLSFVFTPCTVLTVQCPQREVCLACVSSHPRQHGRLLLCCGIERDREGGFGGSGGRPVELGQPVPLGALDRFTVPQLLECSRLLCLAVWAAWVGPECVVWPLLGLAGALGTGLSCLLLAQHTCVHFQLGLRCKLQSCGHSVCWCSGPSGPDRSGGVLTACCFSVLAWETIRFWIHCGVFCPPWR